MTTPYSTDIEETVLGCLISGGSDAMDAGSCIRPEFFFSGRNREIFTQILKLHQDGIPVDAITVSDKTGDPALIHLLSTSGVLWANMGHYLDILRDKYRLRRILEIGKKIEGMIALDKSSSEILPEIEREMFELGNDSVLSENELQAGCAEVLEQIDLRLRGEIAHYGLRSGIKVFDEIHGGFQKGLYYVLAGFPSAGKTAFACQCLLDVAIRQQKPCLFISIEMSRERIVSRMACSLAGLNFSRYVVGGLSTEELKRMKVAHESIRRSNLILTCPTDVTGTELRSMIRKAKRMHHIELAVVDYLQKVVVPADQDERRAIGDASQQMQRAAKETGVPCLVLCQLNRASQKEARPRMSHLAESSQIERDADCVDILWPEKDSNDLEPGEPLPIILTVDKNKEAMRGDQKLLFDGPTLTFKERK